MKQTMTESKDSSASVQSTELLRKLMTSEDSSLLLLCDVQWKAVSEILNEYSYLVKASGMAAMRGRFHSF